MRPLYNASPFPENKFRKDIFVSNLCTVYRQQRTNGVRKIVIRQVSDVMEELAEDVAIVAVETTSNRLHMRSLPADSHPLLDSKHQISWLIQMRS